MFTSYKTRLVTPDEALPGRDHHIFPVPTTHAVLGTPIHGPFPEGTELLFVGMGCFWGAEKKMWRLPGVFTTAVGYQGGITPYPTYEEVCTGRTGHSENVLIAYDPAVLSHYDLLKVFWENHDPTQGYRQGNDVGTQYRSALYFTSEAQREVIEATAASYDAVLRERKYGQVTTEIAPAMGEGTVLRPFYYAEEQHQQYLYKVPHGYDCHANTGIELPPL
ncbi:MAG: peptide-methionine (S)-S-oxide reductase MsrA [Actinobacteria bacterium]|nr:peptide-methionine (S)-S-oxide reductase MsrA [Actinomycetota bacterium]